MEGAFFSKKVKDTEIILAKGSVLDFNGDAIVNAANEGCVGGFGVDEAINKAGGFELKEARKKLGGCKTGFAKITPSFAHEKVKWIIHAVGPVYRIPFGENISEAEMQSYFSEKDIKLYSAYKECLKRAEENNIRSIGFCLLSAGVFRGQRKLDGVVEICLSSIIDNLFPSLEKVVIYAYTDEEEIALKEALTILSL